MNIKKNMRFLYATAGIVLILAGCAGLAEKTGQQEAGGASVASRYLKVYDGSNAFLGYCLTGNAVIITVLTSANYICDLSWNGTVDGSLIYFTEQDGEGTPFVGSYTDMCLYGKALVSVNNSVFYTFKDVDSTGNAVSDTSVFSYQSYYSDGKLENLDSPENIGENSLAYPLKQISRADAGLPNTISLPIRIQPEP